MGLCNPPGKGLYFKNSQLFQISMHRVQQKKNNNDKNDEVLAVSWAAKPKITLRNLENVNLNTSSNLLPRVAKHFFSQHLDLSRAICSRSSTTLPSCFWRIECKCVSIFQHPHRSKTASKVSVESLIAKGLHMPCCLCQHRCWRCKMRLLVQWATIQLCSSLEKAAHHLERCRLHFLQGKGWEKRWKK